MVIQVLFPSFSIFFCQAIEVQIQAVNGQAMEVQVQAVEDQAECQCLDVDLDLSRHGVETWMVPEHFDLPDYRYDGSVPAHL